MLRRRLAALLTALFGETTSQTVTVGCSRCETRTEINETSSFGTSSTHICSNNSERRVNGLLQVPYEREQKRDDGAISWLHSRAVHRPHGPRRAVLRGMG